MVAQREFNFKFNFNLIEILCTFIMPLEEVTRIKNCECPLAHIAITWNQSSRNHVHFLCAGKGEEVWVGGGGASAKMPTTKNIN